MTTTYSNFWGIDVSKEWIDVSIDEVVYKVEQTPKAIRSFIKKHLNSSNNTLAVLESTGGYELLAVDCLDEAGITVHVCHPNKVRYYAKAMGYLAKTDTLDASILARYATLVEPTDIRSLPSKQARQLRELHSRLTQLKETHHQEQCRLGTSVSKQVKRSHHVLSKVLKKEIALIEQEMLTLVNSDQHLKESYKRLQSMPGIGPLLALTFISALPELGHATKKEIAALVGVAPITNESGKHKGKAYTQNGRASVRRVLYMGALSAIRHNPKMKAFYDSLVARGKLKKVALVAVMRKMLVIANAMMQNQEAYRAQDCPIKK